MEIIPIFAFIVLVVTTGTFIFAIAAYILFKIRERRGSLETASRSEALEAELVAPDEPASKRRGERPPSEATADEYRPNYKFMRYTSEGYIPIIKSSKGDKAQWR